MADEAEFRCFVGGLSWDTDDRSLNKAFEKYGAVDAKVVSDRETGRSRGFGFVTFNDKNGMDDAIEAMNGQELDGRSISVNVAQPRGSGPRERRGGYSSGGGGGYGGGGRDYGGGGGGYGDRGGSRYGGGDRGGGGGRSECYKCGQEGHFARECPSGDGGGDRRGGGGGYGGGGYEGRGGPDRNSSRSSRSAPYDRAECGGRGYD